VKLILEKSSPEISKYYCDKHTDRECFSKLNTMSWYGSGHDMFSVEVHLCDECLDEMYDFIKKKFKIEPILKYE
jgi:hypothetical protein